MRHEPQGFTNKLPSDYFGYWLPTRKRPSVVHSHLTPRSLNVVFTNVTNYFTSQMANNYTARTRMLCHYDSKREIKTFGSFAIKAFTMTANECVFLRGTR